MSAQSLVAQPALRLPIAHMHPVFDAAEVERKLLKLRERNQSREHESLCNTYERMLEAGPERFSVKPSGVPDMAPLYDLLPNFGEVLDDVKRHVALSQDSRDALEITAWAEDGTIMGLRHRTLPIEGVQFHPESIASEHGHAMLQTFLNRCTVPA